MERLIFAVFLIVPLIEIAVFIVVGNAIGLWLTLAGVLIAALVGSIVLRRQGLALIAEIRGAMAQGRLPARALAEAMMVAIAGVLLISPGYFTDLIGLLLLIPPVRGAIYAFLKPRVGAMTMGPAGFGPPRRRPYGNRSGTIDLDRDDWRDR